MPVTGYRRKDDVNGYTSLGDYWTSTYSTSAYCCFFQVNVGKHVKINSTDGSRYFGMAVRLVRSALWKEVCVSADDLEVEPW